MEIIIGMVIAFIVGAYVRKPFTITARKAPPVQTVEETAGEREGLSVEEQLHNMLNYNIDTPSEGRHR